MSGVTCHCPRCDPTTAIKLLVCEARDLLRLPLSTRQEFLAAVTKKRGEAAVNLLKAEMEKQWRGRNE